MQESFDWRISDTTCYLVILVNTLKVLVADTQP